MRCGSNEVFATPLSKPPELSQTHAHTLSVSVSYVDLDFPWLLLGLKIEQAQADRVGLDQGRGE